MHNKDLDAFLSVQLLRQFEALLGTSLETTTRDVTVGPESSVASHSGQHLNQTLTSPLLSAPLEAAGKKSSSISKDPTAGQEDQENVCTVSVEESIQKEQTGFGNQDRSTDSCESSQQLVPRLSLFSGMELINRGKPVCLVEPVLVVPETQAEAEVVDTFVEKSSEISSEPSSSSSGEQVSPFSFLNL